MKQNTWVIVEEGKEETETSIRVRVSDNLIVLQAPTVLHDVELRGRISMGQMRFTKNEWIEISKTVAAYFNATQPNTP